MFLLCSLLDKGDACENPWCTALASGRPHSSVGQVIQLTATGHLTTGDSVFHCEILPRETWRGKQVSVENPINNLKNEAETLTLYESSRSEEKIILVSKFARLQLLKRLNRFLSKKNNLGQ